MINFISSGYDWFAEIFGPESIGVCFYCRSFSLRPFVFHDDLMKLYSFLEEEEYFDDLLNLILIHFPLKFTASNFVIDEFVAVDWWQGDDGLLAVFALNIHKIFYLKLWSSVTTYLAKLVGLFGDREIHKAFAKCAWGYELKLKLSTPLTAQDKKLSQLRHPFHFVYEICLHEEAHLSQAISELAWIPLSSQRWQISCCEYFNESLFVLLFQYGDEWYFKWSQISFNLPKFNLRAH